ncbi:MAG: trehalose-phosphatase [SAR202 cluster bacterium Io17-Chloro-G2]|nr:MAG: trehalose-phosphatase [SAR202 cluster bacterium Io17-Chloro-G2]
MPHLLHVWPNISQRLLRASHVLLLFDYDGTLTPLMPNPGQANLPPQVRKHLTELVSSGKYLAGVISGRSLKDVVAKVGIPGMIYAGNHGLEIQGPGLDFVHQGALEQAGAQVQVTGELESALAGIPGVIVEPKGLTLSVHYRSTPEDHLDTVEEAFARVAAPFVESGTVRITHGKKVLEVRPNLPWDKGKAITMLQETYPQASLTCFFGDDQTDEDGFGVVQESGGIAVLVGPARQPTTAWHRLDSPGEVAQVLSLLAQG